MTDEEIYESLIPTTFKDAEKNLKPMSCTDQQRFNQEELDIRLLLDLDANSFSTDIDLDDTKTLRKSPGFVVPGAPSLVQKPHTLGFLLT